MNKFQQQERGLTMFRHFSDRFSDLFFVFFFQPFSYLFFLGGGGGQFRSETWGGAISF